MTLNKTFAALSDPTRRKILDLLKKNSLPVMEMAQYFSTTLPTLSHHLNVLKQANLVTTQRKGQQIIYSLNLSVFEEIAKDLCAFFTPHLLKKGAGFNKPNGNSYGKSNQANHQN